MKLRQLLFFIAICPTLWFARARGRGPSFRQKDAFYPFNSLENSATRSLLNSFSYVLNSFRSVHINSPPFEVGSFLFPLPLEGAGGGFSPLRRRRPPSPLKFPSPLGEGLGVRPGDRGWGRGQVWGPPSGSQRGLAVCFGSRKVAGR